MSTPRSDELLFAAGGDIWGRYGTFVKRTLPEEERGTFSRSSDATYTDRSGNLRTAEAGVLRPHYVSSESSYSARLEAARTNELHNSDSPATQTRSLTAGTYTLWMEGSGSVDASGATDGSYGTATEGQSNDLTFTVSAQQDVTFTVNNTVTRFQCEEGSFRSSFIATAGSAVSRAADSLTFPIGFGPQALSLYWKFVEKGTALGPFSYPLSVGNNGGGAEWFNVMSGSGDTYQARLQNGSDSSISASSPTVEFGDVVELVATLNADGGVALHSSINDGDVASTATATGASLPSSWIDQSIGFAAAGEPFHCIISGPIIAPGVRTMDEMRSLEV